MWGTRVGTGLVRALSLVIDILLFSALAILLAGWLGHELLWFSISLALAGVIAQALFLRRFRARKGWPFMASATAPPDTKVCASCNRSISADAKFCRYCLAGMDEQPELTQQTASQIETEEMQLQTERWQAATNVP
jgi:hypothetical protein